MRHNFIVDGYSYRLRPVAIEDAEDIIEIRLEDSERNKFIHSVSNDASLQRKWIEKYLTNDGDYYFVVENRFTLKAEGLIGLYNLVGKRAEWGRWVVKKNSLSAVESVLMIFDFAFNKLGLDEVYCRTVAENQNVVSFHDSIGELREKTIKNEFRIEGTFYDAVEHTVSKEIFAYKIKKFLDNQCSKIHSRNIRKYLGCFQFDHIGVATKSIEKEIPFFSALGYETNGQIFEDNKQGIKGLFIHANNQPPLELLENLDGFNTLDPILLNKTKFYHFSYKVENYEAAINYFQSLRAKIISPSKLSSYFKGRICFVVLPNMLMIELIEIL